MIPKPVCRLTASLKWLEARVKLSPSRLGSILGVIGMLVSYSGYTQVLAPAQKSFLTEQNIAKGFYPRLSIDNVASSQLTTTSSPDEALLSIGQVATLTTQPVSNPDDYYRYVVQFGDTLEAIASRFQVQADKILSAQPLAYNKLLPVGLVLTIPRHASDLPPALHMLPDSEVVYSPSTIGFDTARYVSQAGGYLSTFQEYLRSTGWTSASEIVSRVARENSLNPRLLLAVLEYHCQCVLGSGLENLEPDYLLGVVSPKTKGLYRQLGWAANQLSLGYYGWRAGWLREFSLRDGKAVIISPAENAGTVALLYLLAQLSDSATWQRVLDPQKGFSVLYQYMFGDARQRAELVEPLLPDTLAQPVFILPFQPGQLWSYISGPHKVWDTEGALVALDFAPASPKSGCIQSEAWVVAVANGLVVRVEHGAVIQDLDGDGWEQTGWVILYMHIDGRDQVAQDTFLQVGDSIGHPSCQGGRATGTHLHIARKYNGEWMSAGGPVPFVMDGWITSAGYRPYEGTLQRGDQIVTANQYAPSQSYIYRDGKVVYRNMYTRPLLGEE